jgi:predicted unusual protein kinase regulating ubiquinone biosynthesis (AarF/ABC1/UbiB family)
MKKRGSKLGAAWTAGRLAGRRVLGRKVGERDTELGELLTGQLDTLKGLPMKLGQIVSYMDVPLPEEVQASMSRLQTGQRGLDPEETRHALELALGAPLESLFEEFELAPVAAASIGQVHKARVQERWVAVKLQYPGIAGTFERDLGMVNRIASLASLASAVDGKAIVGELAARLEEECDYAREARMQQIFADAFAEDSHIHVPAILPQLSAKTVLTSEWVDGLSFEALQHCDDQARIDAVASVLLRFSYHSLLNLALIQADPHPGNFLFGEDGRVTFLDFGCVRQLDVEFVEALRRSIRAVRDSDREVFRESVIELGLVGRPKKFNFEHFFTVMEHLYRPLIAPEFLFDANYVKQGLQYNGPSNPNARHMSIPPAYVWVMRLQWGLWSILSRLNAQGSFAPLLNEFLEQPVRSPST